MSSFLESGLVFSFPPAWQLRKYDEHTFYRGLSGRGLKAVDFIVLLPDGRLCLIEVKNYHSRQSKDGQFHPVERPKASELANRLTDKYTDSARAIRVIDRYYRSKWYYRLRSLLFPAHLFGYRSDLQFWTEAARRLAGTQPTLLLLWLETPKAAKRYRSKIFAHLAQQTDPSAMQLLLGGNGHNPFTSLEVVWEKPQ